jgi:hypothetical protein
MIQAGRLIGRVPGAFKPIALFIGFLGGLIEIIKVFGGH